MIKVGIIGATGYAGSELININHILHRVGEKPRLNA